MSVKVVATGVFDIIHIGHAHFLNAAKEHGNHLTVIVANDATAVSYTHLTLPTSDLV